ncbi:DUF3784 domain-containing protein [Lysinibacillus odysseyi]|uniref:DUF3784 domain-containing protein n=1 Tax=Lysinibacillus odysseyi 34hs-1 = NBRC 100172 TaxID=1220589 RepID=A0A0A3IJY2_9BACI|nr:DUF3784 domain-containing protein [Lysinibacillus odysseyi]KGR85059.1 hypothetical protein CD32_11475 [Lysinibacillus odysseyi 34hs-1 = NBRC 100172]
MGSTGVSVIVIILSFAGLGILFRSGKGLGLLGIENEEKKHKAAVGKFAGNLMFALSGAACMWLLYLLTDLKWALYAGSGLFLCLTVLSMVYKPVRTNSPE